MIALPLLGLVAGLVIGRRWAFAVTAAATAIGFSLVAVLTDEISGWGDGFVWVVTALALVTTWAGPLVRLRLPWGNR